MTRIYLDCDGVLADFNNGFEQQFGVNPEYYEETHGSKQFWFKIRNVDGFYKKLPLMQDAMDLFHAVEHLRPIILTGCPFGGWAESQKMSWRDKHFPGIPMVTCMSRHKKDYCKPGDVLIDDYIKYKQLWEDAGGTFVLHTDAQSTIDVLKSSYIL